MIHLDQLTLKKIEIDAQLVGEIMLAIITARTQANPTRHQVYKRPEA